VPVHSDLICACSPPCFRVREKCVVLPSTDTGTARYFPPHDTDGGITPRHNHAARLSEETAMGTSSSSSVRNTCWNMLCIPMTALSGAVNDLELQYCRPWVRCYVVMPSRGVIGTLYY